MSRKLKCRYCGNKFPEEEVYRVIHITRGGNEQKRNYCCENHYRLEEREIWLWGQIQLGIDYMLGYKCIAKNKTKMLKEIIDSGYTRSELYECMLEMKDTIVSSLEFRKDITSEYQRISYIFSILKNNIRDITLNNKKSKLESERKEQVELIDIPDDIDSVVKPNVNKKKTLMDIIKEAGTNE